MATSPSPAKKTLKEIALEKKIVPDSRRIEPTFIESSEPDRRLFVGSKKHGFSLRIALMDGKEMVGVVTNYGKFSVIIRQPGEVQYDSDGTPREVRCMVYKHAIRSISYSVPEGESLE